LGINGGKSSDDKKKILSSWVNAPTDEGFTAIHFATYHGNYALLKFLSQTAEANIHVKNKFGSSVMHVAAQGD
jgi:ankyrin repeat protein